MSIAYVSLFFHFKILLQQYTLEEPPVSLHRSLLTCWGQNTWWHSKGSKCLPLPWPMLLSALPVKREGSWWLPEERGKSQMTAARPQLLQPYTLPICSCFMFPLFSPLMLSKGNWLRSPKAADCCFLLSGEEVSCGADSLCLNVLSPNWHTGGGCP